MEDNIRPREAPTQEGKAHDQETQTTFDINGSIVNYQPPGRSNIDRNHSRLNSLPWSGRYPPTYPDNHYPYGTACPTPPSPHHGHGLFYPGKSPHWHHPDNAVVYPSHYDVSMPPAHMKQNEYPRRNYFNSTDVAAQHRHAEIARPKPEWPTRGTHHSFPKPSIPSHYLASVHGSHKNVHSEYGGPPSTATSLRSTVLDVSGSNISTPRASAHINRKRARSNTPSSIESIDLNMLIRNSPDSLLGCLAAGSRISSAGSFGHLSPVGFCTSSAYHRVSSAASRPIPFITPPPIHPNLPSSQEQQRDAFPSSTTDIPKRETNTESMSCAESPQNSKTANGLKMKEEAMETKLDSTTSPSAPELQGASDNEPDEGHGEVDEPNLTCQWRECTITFDSQADLVNHVNGDHIKKEKRDFTCYWKDCCREQKPFKAQYMLVVHMRRHTGEKPHVCTYAGCTKAYSRLENLKTHLRSHTGERPYVCEVEGCSKAFSNASDRAKHQNRTHSSVKPYVCKVPGCPKRYTDPSSLRKHTKTVHGDQGVKRLKSDTNKETPNNTSKTTTNQSNKPVSNNNSLSMAHSPSSDIKSPASGSGSGTVKKVSGYTSSIVSSTCDIGSPSVDIPCNNEGSLGVANQPQQSGLSPRSPPYVNSLPGIAEGNYEPGVTESASTTIESVVCERQSQTVTLPKIHNKSHDIASWVSEVHRRMSQTSTRRSSEGSHLSVELTGDASRRSSESGWASNNESRRSSQTSLVPHPPNAHVNQLVPRGLNTLLPPMTDPDDIARRASETSNTSSQSLTFNRQSRSSSGYGSHPRSPMFHRMPYILQKDHFQFRLNGQNRAFRRSSDTVICEADSSDMSRKGERGEELRRRSEPTQTLSHMARQEPQVFSNFMTNEAEPRETELINDAVDPNEFDAYLNPGQIQSQMARETQPLRHFPYPPDYPNQHPMESQTIHYRPNLEHSTRTANQHYPPCDGQSPVPNRLPRYNPQYTRQEFYQRQQRLQTLPQGQMVLQYQQRALPVMGYYGEEGPIQGDSYGSSVANYEDILNGMEGLSTNGGPEVNNGYSLGNGNMVINDMNTLLNSLIEEDKYLEMQQNTQRMAGSSMSSLF